MLNHLTQLHSTSPISNDVTSPVTTLATGPLLSDNMAATPNIIFTTSPSPSTHHRSSFPVDHSPYHCVSPILTAPVDSQCPPDVDSKGIVSPKLSPIKAKSFVTPDGMTTPNAHPSSGKSTSTPGTVCLSVCLYVCMYVCMCCAVCVCLSICLSVCYSVCCMCMCVVLPIIAAISYSYHTV